MSNSPVTANSTAPDPLLPVYAQWPFVPVSGTGVFIETACGRRILDLYGGHAVCCLGYGHPAWAGAVADAARTLSFQSNAAELAARSSAAARLLEFTNTEFDKVFFVNSGAEANENALRLALRHTGRTRITAVEGGFHGRTAAAAAVTDGAVDTWYGFPELPFGVDRIGRNDRAAVATGVGDATAAVIVEPVQGVAGAVDLDPVFLELLRQRCNAVGALLIFDEVQCGVGRTGHPFAADALGIQPDLLTTAKALGNGYPVGAVLVTQPIAESVGTGDLGTTFGGAPMACAAIEAVIETIRAEGLLQRVRTLSAELRRRCVTGPVTGVQGAGFLLGLRTEPPAREVRDRLLERDILVGTSKDPNVIRLLPPYTLDESHVDLVVNALETS